MIDTKNEIAVDYLVRSIVWIPDEIVKILCILNGILGLV